MARRQRWMLAAFGVLFLASAALAQENQQQENQDGDSSDEDSDKDQQKYPDNDYQSKNNSKYYYEQLSLVEYELFDMDPVMFTLYGEEFVDSVNEILGTQSLNSSVIGVLVSDQEYEESTMVATIILSYFNDTMLSQLEDIETYIASYIYDNKEKLSLQTARIASVHSRKVSSLSSESNMIHKGWVFIAGSSTNSDSGSTDTRSPGSVATVRYNMVEFTLGHGHSFGYGVDKKRSVLMTRAAPKEIAELDDDFIEWYKFKVFHTRNAESVSENTKDWKSMTWSERSLQQTAETVWSHHSRRRMGTGAITGTVLSIVTVAIVAVVIVGYVMYRRRRKHVEKTPTPSLDKVCNEGADEISEETALV